MIDKLKLPVTIIIVILFILMLAGCRRASDGSEMQFETVSKDFYSSFIDKEYIVINDENSFEDLLVKGEINTDINIDFNNKTVLVSLMGQKMTGGYDIEIIRVIEEDDKIIVNVSLTEPSEDEMLIQAITSPYHIVSINRTQKDIVFEE